MKVKFDPSTYFRWPAAILVGLLLYIPLNSLVAGVVAEQLNFESVKLFKDLLLLWLLLGVYGWGMIYDRPRVLQIIRHPLSIAIAGYLLINLLYVLPAPDTPSALFGLLLNTRFAAVFWLCWYLAVWVDLARYKDLLIKLAAVICGLGFLWLVAEPLRELLVSLGYPTVNQVVDQNPSLVRQTGTLRGPNEFGAWLVVIILLLIHTRRVTYRNRLLLALLGLTLVFTYSRSAILGLVATVLVYVGLAYGGRLKTLSAKRTVIVIAVVLLSLVLGGWLVKDTAMFQRYVLHSDPVHGSPLSSDDVRWLTWAESGRLIVDQPLGYGLGTAGTASIHNPEMTHVNDNYYLQLMVEMGVAGLTAFLFMLAVLVRYIYRQLQRPEAVFLLSTLAGASVIAFFLHSWGDEAITYLWWSLAGLSFGRAWHVAANKAHVKV